MTRKKVTLEVRGEDFPLEEFTLEEKENLQTFLQEDPQLINFYVLRELMRIRKRLGLKQWVQKYEYRLDTAKTNLLIDQFPTRGAKYLFVHSNSGLVNLNFDSVNEPVWVLATKDQFQMPFNQIYLSWAGQVDKKLVFYVSNQKIEVTTLA